MLSLSTCWNSHRHTRGESMLKEIVELGFEAVELGHGVRLSLMEGICKYVARSGLRVSSLHNFCPLPVEVMGASPNCYEFTSHRESERKRALKLTKRTIDFARQLGAPNVVLHMGRVPMPAFTHKLIELAEQGGYLGRAYVRLKLQAVKLREKRAALYLERAKAALQELAEYAANNNVHLGVESREAYEEIPSEREMQGLLESAESPFVGYWHDIGHIQIKENLALIDHAEWLARIRSQVFGCHLHDVDWPAGDHLQPFAGQIDYQKLIPLLPKNCLLVWEMSPRRTREEIIAARDLWLNQFG